jgi:hypothetical protein
MFKSGHKKMGGRKRGSKNKKTLLAADELLLKLNINPIEKLINIAESDDASIEQQIRCWQEISKYTYLSLNHKKSTLSLSLLDQLKFILCRLMAQGKNYSSI